MIMLKTLSNDDWLEDAMSKVVTMGEIMLRLSTPGNERFCQADNFLVHYGGGEANVAVALSCFGHETQYVTKVPKNPIGESAVAALKKAGVGTDFVAYGGERLGIYYLEPGASLRASNVVYDRAHSAISAAEARDFDFKKIFSGAELFHFSGITPALSDSAAELTMAACKAAKAAGVTVSCDLNYRSKLWSCEKAGEVMKGLLPYVDIFFCGPPEADHLFGISAEPDHDIKMVDGTEPEEERKKLSRFLSVFSKLSEEFSFQYVVSTIRESCSASDNSLAACVYNGKTKKFSYTKKYRICPIIDRIGGGDAFAGGFLSSLLKHSDEMQAISFGLAASVLKHTIPGDYLIASEEEVNALLDGNGSGVVKR